MNLLSNPTSRLFIGAALISLSAVWVQLVDISPSASGFYRVLIGGLALSIFLLVTCRQLRLSKRHWLLFVVAPAFLVLDLWFWHRSIVVIGPGLATLLANFQVFIMMIVGVIFLRQMPTPTQMLAVPLALVGLSMIVGFDWSALPGDYKYGVVLGLLTALAYACYLLTLRKIRSVSTYRVPSREVAVVSMIAAAIMAIIVIVEEGSIVIPSNEDLGWLIAYGVFSHCLGWLFIVSSLSEVSTVQAGLALLLQPTLSFVWDILFFDRLMTGIEVSGAVIALTAIYFGSRTTSKQL
ncbi:MAG: DMT family transporter [Woeseiaceae bacterium]|nr:DMT family transporter [Woeseiaceae bacterium]